MSSSGGAGGPGFGMGALIGQKGVKYGLTVRPAPGAAQKKPFGTAGRVPAGGGARPPPRKPVFGEEDSDDEEPNVEQQIARQAARKQSDKKVADMHAAALAEDASIFDYDSHYDAIQASRDQPKQTEKLQRQSRYIAGLLEKAEERKREQDVLYERQLAKERAAEDHLFGDKERFVTGAYRKKLEEQQKWKEEQKRKKEEEEANAVEKRGHMGDFYRNLLRSNVAFGAAPAPAQQQQEQLQQWEQGAAAEQRRQRSEEAAAEEAPQQEQGLAAPRAGAEKPGQQQGEPGGWEATQAARAVAQAGPSAAGRPEPEAAAAAGGKRAAGGPAEANAAPAAAAPAPAAGERRNREDAVAAARERYLARKRQKTGGALPEGGAP